MELYGTDRPHDVIYRSAHGKVRHVTQEEIAKSAADCTFKKGDKDPCPTCPRLITCLHSCGLLQDELAESEETEPPTT